MALCIEEIEAYLIDAYDEMHLGWIPVDEPLTIDDIIEITQELMVRMLQRNNLEYSEIFVGVTR